MTANMAGLCSITEGNYCIWNYENVYTFVHFVELTAMRQLGSASLEWPSLGYALELLAWDVFLGLSLIFAAFTFEDSDRECRVRRGLLVCGILCLLGIVGPMVGNMRLQLVGVFAYGGVLPVVCLLLSRLFRGDVGTVPAGRVPVVPGRHRSVTPGCDL